MREALTATVLCLMLVFAGAAHAAPEGANPFGVRAPAAAPSAAASEEAGPWRRFWTWAESTQQQLHRSIGKYTVELGRDHTINAGVMLVALSFAYGVLHALGPGHGKAIIATYAVANAQTIRRGVALSFASAFVQGFTAIAIASVLILIVNAASMEIQSTVGHLESASYALIALTGCWLLYISVRRYRIEARAKHAHAPSHIHDGEACSCGHAHIPDAAAVSGDLSPVRAASIVLAVGIRPCTGALIALIVALQQHIFFAGVIAALANSLGTAITVSAMVTMAMGTREAAVSAAGRQSGWGSRLYDFAAIGGALLLVAMGVTLFIASLGPARPFL
jgi:nickel/cobalt transporter (NicO) family protein